MDFKHTDITELIIKAFYTVYHALGYGFLEKVYRNAMVIELHKLGLDVTQEARITVHYDGKVVGEYFADLLVAGAVIVELKAVKGLSSGHEAQLLNYLKATPYEVGLLLNFGPVPEIKRKAFDNSRKGSLRWLEKQPHDKYRSNLRHLRSSASYDLRPMTNPPSHIPPCALRHLMLQSLPSREPRRSGTWA